VPVGEIALRPAAARRADASDAPRRRAVAAARVSAERVAASHIPHRAASAADALSL